MESSVSKLRLCQCGGGGEGGWLLAPGSRRAYGFTALKFNPRSVPTRSFARLLDLSRENEFLIHGLLGWFPDWLVDGGGEALLSGLLWEVGMVAVD